MTIDWTRPLETHAGEKAEVEACGYEWTKGKFCNLVKVNGALLPVNDKGEWLYNTGNEEDIFVRNVEGLFIAVYECDTVFGAHRHLFMVTDEILAAMPPEDQSNFTAIKLIKASESDVQELSTFISMVNQIRSSNAVAS